jgi:hypothetical protein
MLLLDYSQVVLSNVYAFKGDLKKTNTNRAHAVDIIRHATLTGIKSFKKKYGRQYGEVVIACDGREYWRKEIFPYYKAGRSKTRAASDMDWGLIFDTMSELREDLRAHFPYKVIHNDRWEGDDVIGVLTKWTQTNNLVDRGMFDEKQPVMIISSDGDFKQLHKYDNVRQWSPIQKKIVVCPDPAAYLREHIACAGDDGIPNVLSPDHVFVTEGIRQSKMTASKLERFIRDGRDGCADDTQRRNWDRNNTLINLDLIPEDVANAIVDTYQREHPAGDRMSIYEYLVKHKCRLLLDEIEEF